jgi:hypothetical protein
MDPPISTGMDLDLLTEDNAIKMHLEQLKKDESALMEERRLLESEKAAHQKVTTIHLILLALLFSRYCHSFSLLLY